MLSSTGRSRMWDHDADGYARGEGFVVIVLKMLDEAIADNDNIECVIRETAVNQDGRSSGLTVPCSLAQTTLIRSAYSKCGLDPRLKDDRCQYFEAHGTGTPVGDPKEAEAIRNVFFPEETSDALPRDDTLYVGSVKTVIGHSEGAAGLAALLKASLSVQYGRVLPNMHFNKPNPEVEKFCAHLTVPTKLLPWPDLPYGVPRRASVNSFGFGGTNAHAIIESWEPKQMTPPSLLLGDANTPRGPITLSAYSETSLLRSVASLSITLQTSNTIVLKDLAWTLQSRRTEFPFRATFAASNKEHLVELLEAYCQSRGKGSPQSLPPKLIAVSKRYPLRLLGVFTGQGSQWPGMGLGLLERSSQFRCTFERLDASLQSLPDSPDWSLATELRTSAVGLKIHHAGLSQPLTTALQIALIDLLNVCGVSFQAVVGHSSGEIAAAYAAGYLTAEDAIRIAYYRGLHSLIASSIDGKAGKMMAAGMDFGSACLFCQRLQFDGKIKVAASNSNTLVTLSGDEDAIVQAKSVLDEEHIFARILNVDKAYHSHHMDPCLASYLTSVRRCEIKPQRTSIDGHCSWYSSVYGTDGSIHDPAALGDSYWIRNMSMPVLFSQAIERAVREENCFDLVLEVGPHATMKAPVKTSFKTLTGVDIPYCGVLNRNEDDMNAFNNALGFVWKNVQASLPVVNFNALRRDSCETDLAAPQLVKGLPSYSWDHEKSLFKESRRSKLFRTQPDPIHELLGRIVSCGNRQEIRWRNILKLNEVEWLRGHQFQSQVIFPVSGYISMAFEAAAHIARGHSLRLVELNDLEVHRAMTIEEGPSGTEVTFVIKALEQDPQCITAEFSCYSGCVDATPEEHEYMNCTGRATITLGEETRDILPPRVTPRLSLTTVDASRFYSWVSTTGIQYSGDFLANSIKRRLNLATVTMRQLKDSGLHIHPGTLDSAFHGLFAAYSFPEDGRLWAPFLPATVKRVRINPTRSQRACPTGNGFLADCYIQHSSSRTICGDVDIFCGQSHHPTIQVEGLRCSALSTPTPANDRNVFTRTVWRKDIASGLESTNFLQPSSKHVELYCILERTSYYFLRRLCQEVSRKEIPHMEWHYQCLMNWAFDHILPLIETGAHPRVKSEWSTDTCEDIFGFWNKYPDQTNLQLIHALGEAFPSIVRGRLPVLQVVMENDMLARLYEEGLGFPEANHYLGSLTSQLSHQYPRMRVIEIGAGTGGSTTTVLKSLKGNFESYTFTDISPGFFENARARFAEYGDKMSYKLLDIERNPAEQGFEEHSFDLVIASNVIHATKFLGATMDNCRKLLKPGGYIFLLEITSESLFSQFSVCGLTGWWLGVGDGRIHHPTITEAQWGIVLGEHGFSDPTNIYRDTEDSSKYTFSVIVSRAVNFEVDILNDPLVKAREVAHIDSLVLISGQSPTLVKTTRSIEELLNPFSSRTTVVHNLEDAAGTLEPGSVVICVSDLEEPAFKRMSEPRLASMQGIFSQSSYVLWVTSGCWSTDPYANMIVGLGRSVMMESPHLRTQFVDLECPHEQLPKPTVFAELMLRLICLDIPEFTDVLWTNETEIAVKGRDVYIPRIIADEDLNCRLNSERRPIKKYVSVSSTVLAMNYKGGSLVIEEDVRTHDHKDSTDLVGVSTQVSSLFSFLTSDNQEFYICTGFTRGSNRSVLAFSPTNSSFVKLPPDQVYDHRDGAGGPETLRAILAVLVCESLLSGIAGTLWVHNADSYMEDTLRRVATRQGCAIFLSTSDSASEGEAYFIHENITQRVLASLIPPHTQRFIDMGSTKTDRLGDLLGSCVGSQFCSISEPANKKGPRRFLLQIELSTVHHIINRELYSSSPASKQVTELRQGQMEMNTVGSPFKQQTPTSIISWEGLDSIPINIKPLDFCKMFSDNKTYFLVGLAGELGMSLCEWMFDHGARHFAITSRNPKIDPNTMKYLQRKGANIQMFSLDVTDRTALHETHRIITSSMPPIAGVANAAMVLRDKPFCNMTLEDFELVLRPKVDGSRNLDELFHSDYLDFFVLFSSMASIIGNQGQSNYGAANMFMTTLTAQRRKRGVASSIMHIPMLLGVGYLTQLLGKGSTVETQLQKWSMLSLSETEFHVMFAEAIHAGQSSSDRDPEILTGFGDSTNAPWSRTPRFAHFLSEKTGPDSNQQLLQSTPSARAQLAGALDSQEALPIVESALSIKLGLVLQTRSEQIDRSMPLVALGIDSLVAVEIRSWFLKELSIDVPVLKLLGGASLTDICREALNKATPEHSTRSAQPTRITEDESVTMNASERSSNQSEGSVLMTPSCSPKSESADNPTSSSVPSLRDLDGASPSILYQRLGDMSHAQARLYFLHEYLEDKSTYNVGYIGLFRGHLDAPRLRIALQNVCKHHESLRSSYFVDSSSGRAIQAVLPEPNVIFEHKQIYDGHPVEEEILSLRRFAFDIRAGILMKVVVMSKSPTLHEIAFFHHHIALDGASWILFLRDLDRAYSAQQLTIPVQQAIDMSAKKRATCTTVYLHDELAFWRKLHQNAQETLPLFPFSKVHGRQILKSYDTQTFDVELSHDLTKLIRQRCSESCMTSFHFYMSTLAIFLSRCLHVKAVSIGIVDANRCDAEDSETAGCFLNMLPLHFQLTPNETFTQFSKRCRDLFFTALSNSRVPFDMILDDLNVSRSGSHHPLFQVVLNYRNGYSTQSPLGDGRIEWSAGVPARNPYDLAIDITEISGRTILHFTTQRYLYGAADTRLLMKWYVRSLEGLANKPSIPVAKCPISNESDLQHALSLGSGSLMDVSWHGTLAHRIDTVATEQGSSIALKDGYGTILTYSQMMSRSHKVAYHLRQCSLVPGSRVAMLLNPMADHICCLLAVMRLDFVWIPLDLRNPHRRLSGMVTDCQPQIMVCNNGTEAQARTLSLPTTQILNIDTLPLEEKPNVENISDPTHSAVILYTSGSTGTPKGVVLSHQNILNHIFVNSTMYGIGQETIIQQSSLGFDLSLDQTFHALANGGTLVIVSKEGRGDPTHIANVMLSENVTYTLFVTSEYLSLLNYGFKALRKCQFWRFAFSLGEKLTPQLRKAFRKLDLADIQLINAYGPTEATIACSRGVVPYRTENSGYETAGDNLRTMPNYGVRIVDDEMNTLPIGFSGEICISGAGLAQGYLNRPEETDRRFVQLGAIGGNANQCNDVLYRTGDRGRLLEDGSLDVLGRLEGDSQVKIRGIRVELGEISNVILRSAHGVIADAAVSYREESDVLVAFIVFDTAYEGNREEFVQNCKNSLPLPHYMCPTFIIILEQIPMNINGKQDRAVLEKLPLQVPSKREGDSMSYLTGLEIQLKGIWQEVLVGRLPPTKVDETSDFFHVGGNSMLIIKLRSAIWEELGINVALPDLFQSSTLRGMATQVETLRQTVNPKTFDWNIEVVKLAQELPLPSKEAYCATNSSLIVLLTGATGFLGTHILRRLIHDARVSEIHCVAIRPDSRGRARHVSLSSDKIFEYQGNLEEIRLGLSESEFQYLRNKIHVIIHNGAQVSFMKTYQSLRHANVLSSFELCKLAIHRRVPFHFVSTASVGSIASLTEPLAEVSVSARSPPPASKDGYRDSKWVSESLLELAQIKNGLPVWIHRPSSIVGDGTPELDMMTAIFTYSKDLSAVPLLDSTILTGEFDLVSVDDVSDTLVEESLSSCNSDRAEVRFIHHCSNKKIPPEKLKAYFEARDGREYQELPLQEWLEAAVGRGLDERLYSYFIHILGSEEIVTLPTLTKGVPLKA